MFRRYMLKCPSSPFPQKGMKDRYITARQHSTSDKDLKTGEAVLLCGTIQRKRDPDIPNGTLVIELIIGSAKWHVDWVYEEGFLEAMFLEHVIIQREDLAFDQVTEDQQKLLHVLDTPVNAQRTAASFQQAEEVMEDQKELDADPFEDNACYPSFLAEQDEVLSYENMPYESDRTCTIETICCDDNLKDLDEDDLGDSLSVLFEKQLENEEIPDETLSQCDYEDYQNGEMHRIIAHRLWLKENRITFEQRTDLCLLVAFGRRDLYLPIRIDNDENFIEDFGHALEAWECEAQHCWNCWQQERTAKAATKDQQTHNRYYTIEQEMKSLALQYNF